MKKIFLLLIIILLITGCAKNSIEELEKPDVSYEDVNIEELNNVYSGRIIEKQGSFLSGPNEGTTFSVYDVVYTVDGREYRNYFRPELKSALDWISANAPEKAIFLSWWDYGHMIRGYTGREAIVYSPSEDLLWTLASGTWDEESSGEFAAFDDMQDVSFALFGDNIDQTRVLMFKHDAHYVFVSSIDEDIFKYTLFYKLYPENEFTEEEKLEKINDTVIKRFLNEEDFEFFRLVYSDEIVKIYEMY